MSENEQNKKRKKTKIKFGFDTDMINLNLEQLVPLKAIPSALKASKKFQQILTSIREVGIIEPPAVTPDRSLKGRYLLLDGHIRVEALKEFGQTSVICLVSKMMNLLLSIVTSAGFRLSRNIR